MVMPTVTLSAGQTPVTICEFVISESIAEACARIEISRAMHAPIVDRVEHDCSIAASIQSVADRSNTNMKPQRRTLPLDAEPARAAKAMQ